MQKNYCYTLESASASASACKMLGQMLVMKFQSLCIFSCILTLLIILIKPLTTKAHDRHASGDIGTSGLSFHRTLLLVVLIITIVVVVIIINIVVTIPTPFHHNGPIHQIQNSTAMHSGPYGWTTHSQFQRTVAMSIRFEEIVRNPCLLEPPPFPDNIEGINVSRLKTIRENHPVWRTYVGKIYLYLYLNVLPGLYDNDKNMSEHFVLRELIQVLWTSCVLWTNSGFMDISVFCELIQALWRNDVFFFVNWIRPYEHFVICEQIVLCELMHVLLSFCFCELIVFCELILTLWTFQRSVPMTALHRSREHVSIWWRHGVHDNVWSWTALKPTNLYNVLSCLSVVLFSSSTCDSSSKTVGLFSYLSY